MNKRCVKQDYEAYKIIALLTIEKGRRKKKIKKSRVSHRQNYTYY